MGRYDVRCPRTRALGRHEPEPLVCHQCWGGAPATCGRAPRDGPRPRVDARGIDKFEVDHSAFFAPPLSRASRPHGPRTTGERAGAVATPSTTLASTGPLKSQPRCGLPDVTLIRVSGPSISLSVARVSGLGGLDSHWALCSRSPVLSFFVSIRSQSTS